MFAEPVSVEDSLSARGARLKEHENLPSHTGPRLKEVSQIFNQFLFYFQSYCFLGQLVLRSLLVLRIRPPLASLATG